MPSPLEGRVVVMSGGSRGIGLAIAVALARAGARIALLAKTDQPHPKLPGTIHTAAEEIEAAGGRGAPGRRRRPRRRPGGGVRGAGGRALGAGRRRRQQRVRDQPRSDRGARAQALRPDARHQHARHVPAHARRAPAPARVRPRARADAEPAAAAPIRAGCAGTRPTRSRRWACRCSRSASREDEREHGVGANCLWPRTLIATAAVQNLLGGDARDRDEPDAGDRRRRGARDPRARPARRRPATPTSTTRCSRRRASPTSSGYHEGDGELGLDLFVDGWPAAR